MAGAVKVCRECRKLFKTEGRRAVCKPCLAKEAKLMKQIQKYQKENPVANLYEIALVSETSVTKIKKYVKSGKLEVVYG